MPFRRSSRSPKRLRIRKLRFLALLSVLGFVSLVSFAYGLVSAIASDVAALEPSTKKQPQQLGYIYASDGKTVLATLRGNEVQLAACPCPLIVPDRPTLVCDLARAVIEGFLSASGSPLKVVKRTHDVSARRCSVELGEVGRRRRGAPGRP